jgi:uncharacterized membrane protein
MESEKFRRQLRQEAEKWWHDGLIDASVYETIAQRYQFQALESDAKNRFVTILLSLGGILLGLGLITYVAANWQGWPREFRVVLLLALFVSTNAAGFYLWRRSPGQGRQRLGQALLLLGALVLGANLGLLSQMFHQSGNLYELYLVWSLGVLLMAYSLRLVSLGVLALILMAIGYVLGLAEWVMISSSLWLLLVELMPLAVALLFLPLAYRCRSRALFSLTALGVVLSLQGNLLLLLTEFSPDWLMMLAVVLPSALLWSYHDRFWQWSQPKAMRLRPSPAGQATVPATQLSFQAISRVLAGVVLSLQLYSLSFHWIWQSRWFAGSGPKATPQAIFLGLFWLGLVALWGWLKLARQGQQALVQQQWPLRFVNSATVAVILAIAAVLVMVHEKSTLPTTGPLVVNALLFLLSLAVVRDGLAMGQRGLFWSGMALLVVGIMSRTLEYNTDLLLKALAFALCGASIILAGLWFERHAKAPHALSEKSQ